MEVALLNSSICDGHCSFERGCILYRLALTCLTEPTEAVSLVLRLCCFVLYSQTK